MKKRDETILIIWSKVYHYWSGKSHEAPNYHSLQERRGPFSKIHAIFAADHWLDLVRMDQAIFIHMLWWKLLPDPGLLDLHMDFQAQNAACSFLLQIQKSPSRRTADQDCTNESLARVLRTENIIPFHWYQSLKRRCSIVKGQHQRRDLERQGLGHWQGGVQEERGWRGWREQVRDVQHAFPGSCVNQFPKKVMLLVTDHHFYSNESNPWMKNSPSKECSWNIVRICCERRNNCHSLSGVSWLSIYRIQASL